MDVLALDQSLPEAKFHSYVSIYFNSLAISKFILCHGDRRIAMQDNRTREHVFTPRPGLKPAIPVLKPPHCTSQIARHRRSAQFELLDQCEIWGSHVCGYEDGCLKGCCTVWTGGGYWRFRRRKQLLTSPWKPESYILHPKLYACNKGWCKASSNEPRIQVPDMSSWSRQFSARGSNCALL